MERDAKAREAALERAAAARLAEFERAAASRQRELEDNLKARQAELEHAADRLSDLQNTAEARQTQSEQRLGLWEQERKGFLDDVTSLRQKLDESALAIKALESMHAGAEKKIKDATARLEQRERDWAQEKNDLLSASTDRTAQEKEIRAVELRHQRELVQERDAWKAERTRLAAEISQRHDREEEALASVVDLEKRLNDAEQKIKDGIANFKKQDELIRKLEQDRGADESALAEREAELAALRHQLAEDYRKKQADLEALKEQLARDIADLLRKSEE
jgi:chromosome segregation ATPase